MPPPTDFNFRALLGLCLGLLSWPLDTQSNRFTSADGDLLRHRIERLELQEQETKVVSNQALWEVQRLKEWIQDHDSIDRLRRGDMK